VTSLISFTRFIRQRVGPAGGLGSRDESLEKRFGGREAEGLEERPRGQKTIPAAALNRPFALLLMCTLHSLSSVLETPEEAHHVLFDINEHRAEEERREPISARQSSTLCVY
jgi:hypothetical protein